MKATLRVVLGAAALVAAASACEPTPIPPLPIAPASTPAPPDVFCAAIGCPTPETAACEALAPAAWIRADGYRVSCNPQFPAPPGVVGWTDHATATVWVWPSGHPAGGLVKLLDHEHGHVLAELRGLVFADQAAEEDWADGHSFCHAGPQNGIGYRVRPVDCTEYR